MLHVISKIVWLFLSPINLMFLVMLVGALLSHFEKKATAIRFYGLAFLILFLFGLMPFGTDMLALLEARHKRPAELPAHIDGIIVLGGAFETDIGEARKGIVSLNDQAERATEALGLAQQHPEVILIFSGGNGLLSGGTLTEAESAEQFFKMVGFDDSAVFYEDQSRNTFENVKFSRLMFYPDPAETWVLVTSSYHMPRAVAVFETQGWQVIPWAVDYKTDGKFYLFPQRFDIGGNLRKSALALHELTGLIVYRLTGRIGE
jgi:uncharacterized SAM-binding protein YcdF (DUF218 family)